MKKNLFTVPLGIQHSKLYTLRLCAVFLLALFCNVQMKGYVLDSSDFHKDSQAIIYVSGGTQITGICQLNNVQIIPIPDDPALQKPVLRERFAKCSFSEQITAKKDATAKALKSVQEKISKQVKKSFYSSTQDSHFALYGKSKSSFFAVTTGDSSFKFAQAIIANYSLLNAAGLQIKKQELYTSIAFLQFSRLRTSSLRAPPQLF